MALPYGYAVFDPHHKLQFSAYILKFFLADLPKNIAFFLWICYILKVKGLSTLFR